MEPGNIDTKPTSKKRKFIPNLSKALTKKSQIDNIQISSKASKSHDSSKKLSAKRPRINRQFLEDDSRFIQSYSIFETGVGCSFKSDKNAVELQSHPSRSTVQMALSPPSPTDVEAYERRGTFVTDIQQFFKLPPTCMPPDPAAAADKPSCATPSASSKGLRPSNFPKQLFDETSPNGSLFCLRIPDVLLSNESPLQNEGKFGKIQLLDNGEVRLVIGDCFFRLTSPGLTNYSSDVVVVEDGDGEESVDIVNINSLGHIDQFVTATPDLDRFSKLGR